MKRTYTPSLDSLSRQYGERYFTLETVTAGETSESLVYGDLDSIVAAMDATAPDADAATISTRNGRALVTMPDLDSPDSAQVLPQPLGDIYEIRQVDALMQDDYTWYYNETWLMGTFAAAGDVPRAFRRALAKLGVTFYRGRTRTEYDGDVYEIVDRKTGEPLFCAYPEEA